MCIYNIIYAQLMTYKFKIIDYKDNLYEYKNIDRVYQLKIVIIFEEI